ncbi:alpha/beta fold hydrolase [Falsiroseomonas bella]|uniref:alpha/beta fold hydrolase n=1 Tax=Falsiroseomonas bella TaxID=2184016 RepID=UPI001304F5C9|nr:alpha/beta hydrolase [Falsiroseomonas bella]
MTPRRIGFRARDGLALSALDFTGPEGRAPILCLHGITRCAQDFAALAERHAGRRRVLALDLAGHGESARAASPARYGIESALRDVLDAMAALHCPRAIIVGTSFGGILAMVLAVLRPGAVAGAVLNDIGPKLEPVGLGHVEGFVGHDPALPSLEAAMAHLRAVLPPHVIDEAGWRRFVSNTYARGADGLWHPRWDIRIAEAMRAGGRVPELWGPFGALAHAPLMLLRGGLSQLLSTETADRMRSERPDMAFYELPGNGHAPLLEAPPVLAQIEPFLDGIP